MQNILHMIVSGTSLNKVRDIYKIEKHTQACKKENVN